MSSRTAVKHYKAEKRANERRQRTEQHLEQRRQAEGEKTLRAELMSLINNARNRKLEQLNRQGWPNAFLRRRRLVVAFSNSSDNLDGYSYFIDSRGGLYFREEINDNQPVFGRAIIRYNLKKHPVGLLQRLLSQLG